jgi:hypothetical protein
MGFTAPFDAHASTVATFSSGAAGGIAAVSGAGRARDAVPRGVLAARPFPRGNGRQKPARDCKPRLAAMLKGPAT